MSLNSEARVALKIWLLQERSRYADIKYAENGENRARLITAMVDTESIPELWDVQIEGYMDRARTFGLETAHGRQAMGKAIVTMMHCLETAIEVHGPMPKPGVPSGEIR